MCEEHENTGGAAASAPGGRLDGGESPGASKRLCATCANRCSHTPMRCMLLRDAEPESQGDLCHVLRMRGGICGPEGAFWRQADGITNVILFPGERRFGTWPKAGSFDGGGSAA